MKKLTKLISLLLAVMLVCSCFAGLTVSAAGDDDTPDVYSVFGSSAAIFGDVWFAANPATEMTLDETDGLYKITFEDVEPTQMLQFKVLKNHNEDFSWGAPGTDQNYTVNIEQTCDLTITFDPVPEIVNAIGDYVVVPQGLQIDNVIAVGNGEETYLNGANWDPCDPGNMMTEIDPGVWAITMEGIYAFDNYNIKFAANSLDEDDNPVSNPWAINWGAAAEQLYPTGEPIPAVFNGKNCIFEVEEDESTVTIQLDLRNFDYQTKEGATFTITVTPPEPEHVHTPGAATQENVVPADCTNGGSYDEVIKCTECGEEISRTHKTTDALGHVPGTATQENVVPADCTHAGSYDEVVRCTRCQGVISSTPKTIPAIGHDLQFVAKVPATETTTGTKAHYVCSHCHKLFSDAEGMNEVTAESLIIPELGPDDIFTVNAISNVFSSDSETYTDDDGDGIPDTVTIMYYADVNALRLQAIQFALLYDPDVLSFDPEKNGVWDEDMEEYDYSQAFPVTLGSGDVTYVREGRLKFAVANYKGLALKKNGNLVPIAKVVFDIADGAKGTTDVDMNFGVLAFVDSKTEEEYIVYSDASGFNQESYDAVTANNGTIFTVVDHRPVVDEGYDATCTETGLTEGSHCAICGEVIKAQEVIPAKGHTAVTDPKVEATCTTPGKTAGVHCSVCNAIMVVQRDIPAKGHTAVTDPAVPATCTETGLTEGSHCSVCNEVLVAQQTVPAKGHTAVTDPAVPATCTETGLTAGSHCSVCNEVIVAQQTVPAKGHTAVTDPKVDATCTKPGKTAGVHCSVCNAIMVAQREIPAKGHTEVTDPAVPADCTHTGLTEGSHCSVCNEVLVAQQVTNALGHQERTVPGTPATYTETGLTDGVFCDRCQEWVVPQEVIPMLVPAHKIGDINRDGNVDVLDAIVAQKYAADKTTLDAEQLYIGDVNNDGEVDVLDAILIQKYAAEKINTFPKKA